MREVRLREWMVGEGSGIYGVDAGPQWMKVLYACTSTACIDHGTFNLSVY